jgi:hypothetical protein
MQVSRRDAGLAFAGVLLLAIAVVRVAVPDRLRLRALSVQGLDIDDEPLPSGDTISREKRWSPPTDIYLMGWQYRNGGSSAGSELSLLREPGTLRLFVVSRENNPANPAFFQNGAAFRVAKGEELVARYTITNTGPPARIVGAHVLLFYVPVEGN